MGSDLLEEGEGEPDQGIDVNIETDTRTDAG
jgi:hypothetical protein